jgi:hypothetical protein
LAIQVGISGFISAGFRSFSVGAAFDAPIGECKIPGICKLASLSDVSGGTVTGLGSGARIQIYGRGVANAKIEIA